MIIIGLLLIAAAAVFGIDLLVENGGTRLPTSTVFGQDVGLSHTWSMFVVGALCGAAIILGLALMAGSARRMRKRSARRAEERDAVKAERDALREHVETMKEGGAHLAGREDAEEAASKHGILRGRHRSG